MVETPSYISNMEGKNALPRKNGELVFQEPCEGRMFAMAVSLNKKGLYDWAEFTEKLSEEISIAEKKDPQHETEKYYYEHWQKAFEKILIQNNIVTTEELTQIVQALANCKDHDHNDDHQSCLVLYG
jgi:nitrile hydratase accessory protein